MIPAERFTAKRRFGKFDQDRAEAKAVRPKLACVHLGEKKPTTLKVLCVTCKGVGNIDQPVYECGVYGRCLPHFNPKEEAADRWYGNAEKGIEPRDESALYHVCHGCPSRELVEVAPPPAGG